MAVAVEEHPAELVAQAEALEQRAESEMVMVRNLRAEAAKLRSRAERLNHGSGVVVKRFERDDPLLAAAGLAVEDIDGTFTSADLAKLLALHDMRRVARLIAVLREMGHVEQLANGRYMSVDPEAARVRDGVIELDSFTKAELAAHLAMPAESLTWYLADLRARGIIGGDDDERMCYEPTGRETVVTRRFRRETPEQAAVDKNAAGDRGVAVEFTGKPMIETGGNRRRAGERKSRGGNVRKKKQRGK